MRDAHNGSAQLTAITEPHVLRCRSTQVQIGEARCVSVQRSERYNRNRRPSFRAVVKANRSATAFSSGGFALPMNAIDEACSARSPPDGKGG